MEVYKMNDNERVFARHLDDSGKTWFFEPKRFSLPAPFRHYTPDFYVVEENTYYEVAGTRQAFSLNRNKYEIFQRYYPNIKFKIVRPDATIYVAREKRSLSLAPADLSPAVPLVIERWMQDEQSPAAQAVLQIMKIHNISTLKDFSALSGISYSTARNWLKNPKTHLRGKFIKILEALNENTANLKINVSEVSAHVVAKSNGQNGTAPRLPGM